MHARMSFRLPACLYIDMCTPTFSFCVWNSDSQLCVLMQTCTFTYAYIYTHIQLNVHVQMCTPRHVYHLICAYTHVFTDTSISWNACIHVCIHTYIHTICAYLSMPKRRVQFIPHHHSNRPKNVLSSEKVLTGRGVEGGVRVILIRFLWWCQLWIMMTFCTLRSSGRQSKMRRGCGRTTRRERF